MCSCMCKNVHACVCTQICTLIRFFLATLWSPVRLITISSKWNVLCFPFYLHFRKTCIYALILGHDHWRKRRSVPRIGSDNMQKSGRRENGVNLYNDNSFPVIAERNRSRFVYKILQTQGKGLLDARHLDSKPLLQLRWFNLEYSSRLTGKEIKDLSPPANNPGLPCPPERQHLRQGNKHILLVHPDRSLPVQGCRGAADSAKAPALQEMLRLETGQRGSTCFCHWAISVRMWRTYLIWRRGDILIH